MKRFGHLGQGVLHKRTTSLGVLVVGLSTLIAGGGFALERTAYGTGQVTQAAASQNVEHRVNALLAKMTLDEKLEQLQLFADWQA
jgi:hypothetical protein